jgi:hypothetical protein
MPERREYTRYHCKLRVGVIFPDGHSELLWAVNISERGLSIHTDKPQRVGVRLRVVVFLFSQAKRKEVQAKAITKVASCVLDAATRDFRIGLQIVQFVDNAEALITAEVNKMAMHQEPVETHLRHIESFYIGVDSFPLHRRIKLALSSGGILTGWTEEVTPNSMRIALTRKLEESSIHRINIPVVISGEPEIFSVHAKAKVKAVTFRPMGFFGTQFSIFDYEQNGSALLRKELRQRFPEIAEENPLLPDDGFQDDEEDTEALPSIARLHHFDRHN